MFGRSDRNDTPRIMSGRDCSQFDNLIEQERGREAIELLYNRTVYVLTEGSRMYTGRRTGGIYVFTREGRGQRLVREWDTDGRLGLREVTFISIMRLRLAGYDAPVYIDMPAPDEDRGFVRWFPESEGSYVLVGYSYRAQV